MLDQRRRRWPALYKCYTNVLCLLGYTPYTKVAYTWLSLCFVWMIWAGDMGFDGGGIVRLHSFITYKFERISHK